MKILLAVTSVWFALCASVQAGEIYDAAGNLAFHTEDTGKTEEVVGKDGPRFYNEIALINHETGQRYTYSHRWDQVLSNGEVVLDYNFNKRQWRLAEGQGIQPGGRVKGEVIRRIYAVEIPRDVTNNYIENASEYRTPEQGERPVFSHTKGNYSNEFGETVYSLKPDTGGFPRWASIVLLHHHYEKTYISGDPVAMAEKRQTVADAFASSNTIALDMLALGHQYEKVEMRIFGGHYRMVYFTEIDGQIVNLDKMQVALLKNKWLILNEKLRRSTSPSTMPAAGHITKMKTAKKRGVQGVQSGDMIFEIKIRPEYMEAFKAMLSGENAGEYYDFEAANYWGKELRRLNNWTDMQGCAKACDTDEECKIASFHDHNVGAPWGNTCVLRSDTGARHEQKSIYSWIKPQGS
jgi:hypothetical protein